MAFQTIDYVLFGFTLLISAAIGIYFRCSGGKQKTNEEYLVGNRKQNPIIVAVSLMSTFMSAVSLLGGASEAYTYGTHFFMINLGFLLGICLALVLYVPIFYELKSVSVYTYLEMRFGYKLRLLTSIAFCMQMIFYASIALAAPALSLQTVTNMSNSQAVIIVGLVCTFYATIGGMKAIIFTDLFQSILMFSAIFSVIFSGLYQFGGFSNILHIAKERNRIDFTNFSLDITERHTWLSTIVGGTFSALFLKGINQVQIQRYLTMKNYRRVVFSAVVSWFLITILSFTICFCGLIALAKYEHCDPIKSKRISSSDQLLPLYALDTFKGSGLAGIFVSGIFSASLSTTSPLFNSLAAVTLESYIKPVLKRFNKENKIETNSSVITQILAGVYGIICISVSLLALKMRSILEASIIVFSVIGGPMLGVFSLGMFSPVPNETGTIVGFITGIVGCTWILLGTPRPKPVPLSTYIDGCDFPIPTTNATTPTNITMRNDEYPFVFRISYMYYSFIGFFITFVIGYFFSLLIKRKSKNKIDFRLFIKPVASRLTRNNSVNDAAVNLGGSSRDEELTYRWNTTKI